MPSNKQGPRSKKSKSNPTRSEDEIPLRLHPDEPKNFLDLTLALKCWLSRMITEQQIDNGKKYILDYLKGLHEVCQLQHL